MLPLAPGRFSTSTCCPSRARCGSALPDSPADTHAPLLTTPTRMRNKPSARRGLDLFHNALERLEVHGAHALGADVAQLADAEQHRGERVFGALRDHDEVVRTGGVINVADRDAVLLAKLAERLVPRR